MVSPAWIGTLSVTVKSPNSVGFHTTASLVRPCGAMRTSLTISSPSEVLSVTVVSVSRGSELSMEKGIRTGLLITQ